MKNETKHTPTLYIDAQNDALYITSGRPPSKDNDYPVHDADRTVIAKIYEEAFARPLVDAFNAHDSLIAALEMLHDFTGRIAPDEYLHDAMHKARAALAKAKGV